MYIFLWGGWVARPSAFLFFTLTLVPCLILSGLHGLRGRSVFRCRLTCSMLNITALCRSAFCCRSFFFAFLDSSTLLQLVDWLNRVQSYCTLSPVPVPSIPSISTLLG